MEAIHQIVDGNILNKVISIPRSFLNRKVQVMVWPVEEEAEMPRVTSEMIHHLVEGSITQSLIGSIPMDGENITLDAIREERLRKYEYPN